MVIALTPALISVAEEVGDKDDVGVLYESYIRNSLGESYMSEYNNIRQRMTSQILRPGSSIMETFAGGHYDDNDYIRLLNEKYEKIGSVARNMVEACDSSDNSFFMEYPELFGHWHLNYINNNSVPPKKTKVAIIDSFVDGDDLMPNIMSIYDCKSKEECTAYSWDFVGNSGKFKDISPHYHHGGWIASIVGSRNCANPRSRSQTIGVNPLAEMVIFNIARIHDREVQHAYGYIPDAIRSAKNMGVKVIIIPLVFSDYRNDIRLEIESAVSEFLEGGESAIVAPYGNVTTHSSTNKAPIPCAVNGVICVSGLDRTGIMAEDVVVDVPFIKYFAPAVDISGGFIAGSDGIPRVNSGSSAATAIIGAMLSKMDKPDIEKIMNKDVFDSRGNLQGKGASF